MQALLRQDRTRDLISKLIFSAVGFPNYLNNKVILGENISEYATSFMNSYNITTIKNPTNL